MKCSFNTVNLCFKSSITDREIDDFSNARQHFSDCYIMTTLETLSHTENGRKLLHALDAFGFHGACIVDSMQQFVRCGK